MPGDFARVEADGSIVPARPGLACINTGGEKVYPEEVEEAVKLHPDGRATASWSECPTTASAKRSTAVVASPRAPRSRRPDLTASLDSLARYKRPRRFVFVPEILRGPNGKADYKWARAEAPESSI